MVQQGIIRGWIQVIRTFDRESEARFQLHNRSSIATRRSLLTRLTKLRVAIKLSLTTKQQLLNRTPMTMFLDNSSLISIRFLRRNAQPNPMWGHESRRGHRNLHFLHQWIRMFQNRSSTMCSLKEISDKKLLSKYMAQQLPRTWFKSADRLHLHEATTVWKFRTSDLEALIESSLASKLIMKRT